MSKKQRGGPGSRGASVSGPFPGRRCFICNDPLRGLTCQLARTNTKASGTPFADCLSDVIGGQYEVVVSNKDKSCQRCAALVQQRDKLTQDLNGITKTLHAFLQRKYALLNAIGRGAARQPATVASITAQRPVTSSKVAPAGPVELYQCIECHYMTSDPTELKSHACGSNIPKESKFKCNFCDLEFDRENDLHCHTESHLLEEVTKLYHCSSCEQVFNSTEELEEHEKNHPVTCGHCGNHFQNMDLLSSHLSPTLKIHMRAGAGPGQPLELSYMCSCCHLEMAEYRDYLAHKEQHLAKARPTDRADTELPDDEEADDVETTEPDEVMDHAYAMEEPPTPQEDIPTTSQSHPAAPIEAATAVSKKSASDPLDRAPEKTHPPSLQLASEGGTMRSVYECGMCSERAASLEDLMAHFKTHRSSRILCKHCGIELPSVAALTKHLQYHVRPGQALECEVCGEALASKDALMRHMADLHRRKSQCPHCGEQFRYRREMIAHCGLHPEARQFKCTHCDKSFLRFPQLQKHLEAAHRDPKCRVCDKLIRDPSKLRAHEARHRIEQYPCDKCDRIFKTPSGLRNHMAIHTGQYKYRCDTCDRGFMNRNIFVEHTNNHLAEPKALYKCDVCGKDFFYQGSLWIHRKWHDNPFPYSCKLCGKKVRHASVLQVHMRKHRGERPYKCPYCTLNFNSPSTFKRHLMLHTGEFAFKCADCDKGFTTKAKLLSHRHMTHGDLLPRRQARKEFKLNVPLPEETSTEVIEELPTTFIVQTLQDSRDLEDVTVDDQEDSNSSSAPRVVEVVIDEEQQAVSSITLLGDPARWN